MAKTRVTAENYDGDKGYIDGERFEVLVSGRKTYLLPSGVFLIHPIALSPPEAAVKDTYRVVRDDKKQNCAECERVEDRVTLARVLRRLIEKLEKEKLKP